MGLRLPRAKPRHWLLSILYRAHRLTPLTLRAKLRWDLDLAWIFSRLAHESAMDLLPPDTHPMRTFARAFLGRHLRHEHRVLGTLTQVVAPLVTRVVGVDYDAAALAVAKRTARAPNVTYVEGDAFEYLTASADRFDVIVLSHIVEHLDDPATFLRRCAEVVPHVYIEVPDFDADYFGHYRHAVGATLNYSDADHVWEFDRDELRQLVAGVGLTIVDAEWRCGVQRAWCRSTSR